VIYQLNKNNMNNDGCDDVGYDPTEKELLEQDAFVAQTYKQMDKTALLKSMSIIHNKDF